MLRNNLNISNDILTTKNYILNYPHLIVDASNVSIFKNHCFLSYIPDH